MLCHYPLTSAQISSIYCGTRVKMTNKSNLAPPVCLNHSSIPGNTLSTLSGIGCMYDVYGVNTTNVENTHARNF